MNIEQFEYSDDISNNSEQLISTRKKKNKKKQFNINPNKIAFYSIFFITIIVIILLNKIYNKKNITNTLESNSKDGSLHSNECDIGYKLENGKCVINYSFKATYETFKDIEQINFTKTLSPEMILDLIIDGEKIRQNNKHIFQKKGIHSVYILLDLDKIDSLDNMFSGIKWLTSIAFSEIFNLDKFTSMDNMFKNCISLTNVDLSKVITKNIITIDFLFSGCTSLNLLDINFSNENLISMSYLFNNCSSLQVLDLSNFKTPKVENMSYAFAGCNKLVSLDLSGFDTKNVKSMRGLFELCGSIISINHNFEINNVVDMAFMFNKCHSLISLDTSKLHGPN